MSDDNIYSLQQKIDDLNQLAWESRVSDSTQANVLSKEAIDLSEQINYDKGLAEGYRTFGFCLIRIAKHHEALEYCEKALLLFEASNDYYGQSSIYEYFGIIYRSLGNYGKSLECLFKALEITEGLQFEEGQSLTLYHLGVTYKYLGNYDQALDYLLKSLAIASANHFWISESYALNLIGQIYKDTGAYDKALEYYDLSLDLRKKAGDKWGEAGCLDNIGYIYFKLNNLHKAIDFFTQSSTISETVKDKKGCGNALLHLAEIYQALGDVSKTKDLCNQSLAIRRDIGDKKGEAEILLFLADLDMANLTASDNPAVLEILEQALQLGNEINASDLLAKIHHSFYIIQKSSGLFEESLLHFELYMEAEKKLHKDSLNEKIQNLEISHRAEQSKNVAEIYRLRNVELANLYEESKKQKDEIEQQKHILEKSLSDLKAAQQQLIQSEKMASFGELTAGIAHEIQNPLNFVNNFSELNIELIEEMMTEDNAQLNNHLLKTIEDNEKKINLYGKRADAIVKSMMQHSRTTSLQKEAIDINALVEEYLRLSYHGFKAKDNTQNISIKTDFDKSIGKINIIPQDIGRVLLNLYNNAFYAVKPPNPLKGEQYNPFVSVSTRQIDSPSGVGSVEIRVEDNGNGIPANNLNKIFQPFFTTKPTGQGTGLGLSLSYDIIKAHGGNIKVESREGGGTVFTFII